jgi:hypothetical protein
MANSDPTGTDWTDREIDLIVADYFDMLRIELSGGQYVKAERNRELQRLTRRSHGSIELKHQNISAVLVQLGMQFIRGYLPRANFQASLLDGIERFLVGNPRMFVTAGDSVTDLGEVHEEAAIFLTNPPALDPRAGTDVPRLRRLVSRFDPAERDARNRDLGRRGEERILEVERLRLKGSDRPDLARRVRWVSQEDGDGAGYDILSFDPTGHEKLLEVKTTMGGPTTPFFLSENERSLSDERPEAFRLVRLYDFSRSTSAFELRPPLTDSVILRTQSYRASFT